MRRALFLAAVLGTQLLAGCYYAHPVFPRLNGGCGYGSCGTPLIRRPVVAPYAVAPYGVAPAPTVSLPAAVPGYPVGSDYGAPGGCTGCGSASGTVAGYPASDLLPSGIPLTSAPPMPYQTGPVMVPYMNPPQNYPGLPINSAPMPNPMPTAMPGGIPHDSALLKMPTPTITPPGSPSISKRPEELARDTANRK